VKIEKFGVEYWMDRYETTCRYNLAETCVDSISVNQLKELVAGDEEALKTLESLTTLRLSYGEIPGNLDFRKGVASLYRNVSLENILSTNGAIGANFLALYTLVEPMDEVVAVVPTYQQHYSLPQSLGGTVKYLHLRREEDFVPDTRRLREMVSDRTRVICLNTPNNPTGQLIPDEVMTEIIEIARECDAYILSDEVYRHLNQEEGYVPSIVDRYEKGISTGSMSKVFSMAGLRLGWMVGPLELMKRAYNVRHYNMISCGMIDEVIGGIALKHQEKILRRNLGIIRENLKILDDFVAGEPHLDYVRPQGGTTALLYYDMPLSSTELCTLLMEEEGIMLVPGDCFDMGRSMRIGYAFNPLELKTGLAKLSEFLRRYD